MQVDPTKKIIVVTVPKRCRQTTIDEFIAKSHVWLTQQHHKLIPQPLPVTLALSDQPFIINYFASSKTEVNAETEFHTINIYGYTDNHKNQLVKYLKTQALKQANLYIDQYAQQLGLDVVKIGVKEYKARWGCCYQRGDIYLSWRLIMAPADIFRYVCAHEVAHLIQQNHSPQFWQIVSTIYPDYKTARRWLHDHGSKLFYLL